MTYAAMVVVRLKIQPMFSCAVPLLIKVGKDFEKYVVHVGCNLIYERFLRVKGFISVLRNYSPLFYLLIMLQMNDFYIDFNLFLDLFMSLSLNDL